MKFTLLSLITLSLFISSCKKEETKEETPQPQVNLPDSIVVLNTSTLISALNGYSFEAAFINTEPVAYPYLWLEYVDDYLDSTRIVMNNQNSSQTITYYLCSNHKNGILTRAFDHITYPNNVRNNIRFSFNHPQFLLQWYVPSTGELTTVGNVFGMNTHISQTFTGMSAQYQYEFLDRYLIRYISGISLWPFQHQNWSDQPQFVATQELSEPVAWDHWYDESWSTFPYDVQSNMYTAFINSSNDTTYVGIAKGQLNLDTLYFRQATYAQTSANSCQVFLDKSGDTLFFGLSVIIPGTTNQHEISLYKYELSSAQLTPVYEKQILANPFQIAGFNKGRFYGNITSSGIQMINRDNSISTQSVPTTSLGGQFKFGRNKLYYIVSELNIPRVEVYSIPM